MKSIFAVTILALTGSALAQSHSLNPGQPAIYDPSKGPLPAERRFVMTREGVEEARHNAQNPKPMSAPLAVAPVQRSYALPERKQVSTVSAPNWFVQLPEDTENATFAAGTATSTDEQMAYDKARMHAERKLVEAASSRISTQTKSYRDDRGNMLSESFQQFTRKNARGELIGAQRVDSQVTHDGQNYKVYVLLRLPLGAANTRQTQRIQNTIDRESEIRLRAAERDMDAQDAQAEQQRQAEENRLKQNLAPHNSSVEQQSRVPVKPSSVPTVNGTELTLLDVDNEEYKKRRAEALAKPGAVIGQTVLR